MQASDVKASRQSAHWRLRAGNGTVRKRVTAREAKMAGVKQGRDGAVGILTLNEPESLNAMTPDLLGALEKAIAELTADPSVRALVLTGEGRGFCSGQNLKVFEA